MQQETNVTYKKYRILCTALTVPPTYIRYQGKRKYLLSVALIIYLGFLIKHLSPNTKLHETELYL